MIELATLKKRIVIVRNAAGGKENCCKFVQNFPRHFGRVLRTFCGGTTVAILGIVRTFESEKSKSPPG